jgi:aminopeptidase N
MTRTPGALAALVAATVLTACTTGDADRLAAAKPSVIGIGDPYFPRDGGIGIDVARYRIRDAYDFASGRLSGSSTLTITATQRLTELSLDFLLPVSKVRLSTGAATYSQARAHELVITPAKPITEGTRFRVTVTYAGTPADATYLGASNWKADQHEAVTVDEPHMAPWWYPSNDHPSDKARFDISITVPRGNTVISNGKRVSKTSNGDRTTFRWRADEPMTTYLAFFAAGRFTVTRGVTAEGVPWVNAVSRQGTAKEQRGSQRMLARTADFVSWLSSRLGEYPFAQTGGVVTSLDVGFSLETQTRPVYGFYVPVGSYPLLVHELAHQWFGDSVSLERWQDVWLNEGFASFMSWMYDEDHGGWTAQKHLESSYGTYSATDDFWDLTIGNPGPDDIFKNPVYERGAMTLQALRNRVGDDVFWQLLRTWVAEQQYGNATTDDFVALAGSLSGQDLGAFFDVWLQTGERPDQTPANGL